MMDKNYYVNKYFGSMVDLLSGVYDFPKARVVNDLISLESKSRNIAIYRNTVHFNSDFWIVAAGKLSLVYRNNLVGELDAK